MKEHIQRTGARGIGTLLAGELIEQQSRLKDLLKTYTEKHPDVIALQEKIAMIEERLRQLPEEEIEYQRLARDVKLNEENYLFLSRKLKEAQIAEAEKAQIAFEDSPALPPDSPIRPRFWVNLGVGAAAGLLLAMLTLLFAEKMDTSLETIDDVEGFVGLPVIAVIPHIRVDSTPRIPFFGRTRDSDAEKRKRLVIAHPHQSPFVEAYHTMRTNMRPAIKAGNRPGIVTAFTSAAASEGKTLTALNFALTTAQSGLKTLFIEADLRHPDAHRLLGLPREPGLADLVANQSTWEQTVRGTADFLFGELDVDALLKTPGIENFRFISAGPSPTNPADILGAPGMDDVLRRARADFDIIIIDCAPIMLCADALLIGPKTDATILVHRSGATPREALKRAKDQLLNARAKVTGVVLNDLHTSGMPSYGYERYADDPPAEEIL
jgi:tyrosine-protein kinase Etk/Wzc